MSVSKQLLMGPFRHGLTFIATLAFVASFFGSRLFAILYPSTVVMTGEIHIHHFWYGIGLLSLAGWFAIAWRNERIYRPCAILYGLGAGFVGDEVGLLLTLGDYQSELTYEFFIGAMSLIIIMTLLVRYRAVVFRDVVRLSLRERATLVGVYFAAFFTFLLFIPSDSLLALPFIVVGFGLLILVYARRRRLSDRSSELMRPNADGRPVAD
ncbi:MAG TPA: hypothetical protein VFE98_06095 [Candidatus Bathyarchaeia archaeon]|nr:hypothetical protein [Candidatus Bathyarchaeia archaeon]